MISIKQYFRKDEQPVQLLSLLLEGVAKTAVEFEPIELASFQKALSALAASIAAASRPDLAAAGVDEALELIANYNRRVQSASSIHQGELKSMLSLVIETVAFLSASSKTSVDQLAMIEKSLESAAGVEDLKLVKNKLLSCLTITRSESARLKMQSEKKIRDLKGSVLRTSTQILPQVSCVPPDPVTGLAAPDAVRQVISRSLAGGERRLLAVIVLQQIPELNRNLGRSAADRIMSLSAQQLGSELADSGPLFRWNGPAVLLILDATADAREAVQKQLGQLAKNGLTCSVELNETPVQFRINFSWIFQEVNDAKMLEDVCRKLDAFVAERTAPELAKQ